MVLMVLVSLTISASALAISNPGLNFNIEYIPDPIAFGEEYRQSDPELYQAHLQLSEFPKQLEKLEGTKDAMFIQTYEDKEIDSVTKQEKIEAIRLKYKEDLQALQAGQVEMRQAFLVLAKDRLLRDADPNILLFLAQQYYLIRGQAPEVLQVRTAEAQLPEKEKASPADATPAEKQAATPETSPAVEAEAAPETPPAVEAETAPETPPAVEAEVAPVAEKTELKPLGNPSTSLSQDFSSNIERVLATCQEIRTRFPEYENMDRVLRLLAAAKKEVGLQDEAVLIWRQILRHHSSSAYTGEILFQMAEYKYATPTSFDHFTLASEYYQKALQYFPAGRDRWRVMYKMAWSQYLSPDITEEAINSFVRLYKEMKAQGHMTEEMLSIKAEILEVIRQIKSNETRAVKGTYFGK